MKIVNQVLHTVRQPATLAAAAGLAVAAGVAAIALPPSGRVKPLTTDQVNALAAADQPATTPTPAPRPEPSRASPVRARAFASPGGLVLASCTAAKVAVLHQWSPAPGYRALVRDGGPAITFSGGSGYATVKVEISCAGGDPKMSSKVGAGKLPPQTEILLDDGAFARGQR